MTLAELAGLMDGTLHADGDVEVKGFATDSRGVSPGFVFLAIRGENTDGHRFAEAAAALGAAATVATEPVSVPHILVDDMVAALARMGSRLRARFGGPVVGITGSVGKTTAKEFVSAALSPLGPIVKTEGNQNTEYTSPLLWARVTPETAAVVVEMGMRGFGQIAHLAAIANPTIGLITNVGPTHAELVGSVEGVARAKAELLQQLEPDGLAVLPRDDAHFEFLASQSAAPAVTFGTSEISDCCMREVELLPSLKTRVAGTCLGEAFEAELPSLGRHLALSAGAALLAARVAGVSLQDAAQALAAATLPPMRMQVAEARGVTWILDMYNAAPTSMKGAIETAAELANGRPLVLALGEMRELGALAAESHFEIGQLAGRSGASRLWALNAPGSELKPASEYLKGWQSVRSSASQAVLCSSLSEMREELERAEPGSVVLVKGSRSVGLEEALPEGVLPS